MHYIYIITCLKNHKIYVGQTNDPHRRWSQHKSAAKHLNMEMVITRAMIKHQVENFTNELIMTCQTQDDIDFLEEVCIQQYDSRNPLKGYNVAIGGITSPRTPEILAKISASLQAYYQTHSGWNKGGTLTEEWRQKISESSMGKPGTNVGKTFDDEWRLSLSKSMAGRPLVSRQKFSKDIELEICRQYTEEEKSTYELGPQFGCQKNTITAVLKRNGVEIRQSNYIGHNNGKNLFTKEQELEICKIYEGGGISRSELARRYECGKTTMRDILLRGNVKL